MAATILRTLMTPINGLWNWIRFGVKVQIDLDWDSPPISFVGVQIEEWRSIRIEVLAPKSEEFVVAHGIMEHKLGWRWRELAPLPYYLGLPWEIAKNRSYERHLDGSAVADALRGAELDQATVRVLLRTKHRQQAKSNSVSVSVQELERRRVS